MAGILRAGCVQPSYIESNKMIWLIRLPLWTIILFSLQVTNLHSAEKAHNALVSSYPDHLLRHEANSLMWRDGTQMLLDDAQQKTHQQRLKIADIEDMLHQRYPTNICPDNNLPVNFDPGRIRNVSFFKKMYGQNKAEVKRNLVKINWFGQQIYVTRINSIDKKLNAIIADLKKLPGKFRKFYHPSKGAFNWRPIAGTERLSIHSFGAAIDLNTRFADYWLWHGDTPGRVSMYHNKVPIEIVEIFERHGFIWGGKWYHYDTMHFEYRPELIALAKPVTCKTQTRP